MLIDVTEEQSEALHEQAERCRRLAGAIYSRESTSVLERMADGFERTAAELASRRQAKPADPCLRESGALYGLLPHCRHRDLALSNPLRMSRVIRSLIARMPWSGARKRSVSSSQFSVMRQ